MPSFNPFSAVTGKHSFTLFEIRLENDFIVFRGTEHESAGQLLKGVVVLCLPTPLKVDDVHLRLNGNLRLSWDFSKGTGGGVTNQKVDKTTPILQHKWAPFVGAGNGKSTILPAGNYEWPFEFNLPGKTPESVEGIPEAGITYRLKATVARGKLAYDLHAYKALRIIRTLEPAALEYLHAMSVENIWPNKVDYSIIIPQKAVVFGASVPLDMRFTPLLKGLELGDVSVKLMEIRECSLQGPTGIVFKEHRTEREVSSWKFEMSREEHWHDTIEDTGQEGWTVTKKLHLPRSLRQCVQDVNHNGIKIRHKIKLVVALRNPDGHISELRATLPVSIFISPNMPLDENGCLVDQNPGTIARDAESATIAPPGYGEHVLDQLYADVDMSGFQTPGFQSGVNSPYYAQSRAGSTENLAALALGDGITPAALSSRLQNVSLDPAQRNSSFNSLGSISEVQYTPTSNPSGFTSQPQSAALTRHNSEEERAENAHSSGRNSPEHIDFPELSELNKVPSYATAVKTPAPMTAHGSVSQLPDYFAAISAPSTPPASEMQLSESLTVITEGSNEGDSTAGTRQRSPSSPWNRPASMSMLLQRVNSSDDRRLHLIQARGRLV